MHKTWFGLIKHCVSRWRMWLQLHFCESIFITLLKQYFRFSCKWIQVVDFDLNTAQPSEVILNDLEVNNLGCLSYWKLNKHLFLWAADLHYALWPFLDPGCNSWQCLHSLPESQKPGVFVCQVRLTGQKCCTAHIPVEISPRYLVEMGQKAVNFSW